MDVLSVILGLLLGLALGAALAAWLFLPRVRTREDELRHRAEQAAEEAARSRERLARAETSVRMLEQQGREREDTRRRDADVLTALAPMGERMRHLQEQVAVLERDRVDQFAALGEQLRQAARTDSALMQQTTELLSTLRSTTARGHWGEVQLRRVVEAAGMMAHTDFSEQATLSGPEGQRLRPDLLVHLPGGKALAVDAKAPAADGVAAQHLAEEQDEQARERRDQLRARHAAAVRRHVDALAQKSYWAGLEESPELVFCFLPSESLLATALEEDPGLLDHAFAKGVALVAPVSLLTALKAVAHAWRQERIAEDAQQVVAAARQLYERLGTLGGHLSKLGSSLGRSVENYNRLLGTLETRVLPSARRIQELDPQPGSPLEEAAAVERLPRPLSAPELTSRQGRALGTRSGDAAENLPPHASDATGTDG